MTTLQLDLFGEIEQAETDAQAAACDRRRDALNWHPSYLERDHDRPGWDDRLHAWTLLLNTLRDAREAIR